MNSMTSPAVTGIITHKTAPAKKPKKKAKKKPPRKERKRQMRLRDGNIVKSDFMVTKGVYWVWPMLKHFLLPQTATDPARLPIFKPLSCSQSQNYCPICLRLAFSFFFFFFLFLFLGYCELNRSRYWMTRDSHFTFTFLAMRFPCTWSVRTTMGRWS